MQKSLTHLPKDKQAELEKIVNIIRKKCNDIEKIILFGSYARGSYKEEKDLKIHRKTGHVSDYDILVITSRKSSARDSLLWKKISQECSNMNLSAIPQILTHDIQALNLKLGDGQYFYSDIKKEGIILFDNEEFQLAERKKLSAREKQIMSQAHYDYWLRRAVNFLDTYKLMYRKSQYSDAAFHLHLATESCYKTILLVFTNYNPNEHFLGVLGEQSKVFHPNLIQIFPVNTKEDEQRFELLEYAYIGGRYDPNYHISKEDLEILAKGVKKLLKITKEICQKKIKSFV